MKTTTTGTDYQRYSARPTRNAMCQDDDEQIANNLCTSHPDNTIWLSEVSYTSYDIQKDDSYTGRGRVAA